MPKNIDKPPKACDSTQTDLCPASYHCRYVNGAQSQQVDPLVRQPANNDQEQTNLMNLCTRCKVQNAQGQAKALTEST